VCNLFDNACSAPGSGLVLAIVRDRASLTLPVA
jgi:hypothetical protein